MKDQQGLAVPGVTVTATSPALQGARTAVTDVQGLYTLNALPPGTYTLKFTLSGFGDVTQTTTLPLGLTIEQNATIQARRSRRVGAGDGGAAGADRDVDRRRQLQARGNRSAGDAAHAPGDRHPVARRHRELAPTPASW